MKNIYCDPISEWWAGKIKQKRWESKKDSL